MSNQDKDKLDFIASLREVRVFISADAIFGIPSSFLMVGILIGAYITAFISTFLGAIFLLVYPLVMYFIHKDDPEAISVWRRAIFSVSTWAAGEPSKTSTIIILEDN